MCGGFSFAWLVGLFVLGLLGFFVLFIFGLVLGFLVCFVLFFTMQFSMDLFKGFIKELQPFHIDCAVALGAPEDPI